MDPISLIVSALAAGAAAGLKPMAEKVVKDAYEGIKAVIQGKYGHVNVDLLQSDPTSKARQEVMKEDLAKTDAGKDEELLRKAKEVLDRVQRHAPDAAAAVGVSLEEIKVIGTLDIADIIASGTGVSAKKVEVGQDMKIEGVRAGQTWESPNPQTRQ